MPASGLARRATAATGGAIRDAGRWESAELDLVRMVTAALGLAVPFGWGLLSGHPGEGSVASIGALLVSSGGHAGSLAQRVNDLLLGAVTGAACLMLGASWADHTVVIVVGLPIAAAVLALCGPVRPTIAKASVQGTVALVLGTALLEPGVSLAAVGGWFLLGALYAGALTLAGHGIAGRITHRADAPEARRRWSHDLRTWAGRTRSGAFWEFPIVLALCLALAELAAREEGTPHATWIALTVVLVMQRDRGMSLSRAVQRGLGTFLGVGLGVVTLSGLPDGVVIAVVALVGAVRGHLRIANYTAYAVVMTPLVLIFLGAGRPVSSSLLLERVGDTALGCLIALVVGQILAPVVVRSLRR